MFTRKLMFTVLGGIFAALAIMLVIALVLGNRTTSDKNNSDVASNSAGVLLPLGHAGSPATSAA